MERFLIISATLIILIFTSCGHEDDSRICNSGDPLNDLAWLKEKVTQYKSASTDAVIQTATYRNEQIFIISPCCPGCSFLINPNAYYTCSGEHVLNIEYDKLNTVKTIWTLPDSKCQ